MRTSVSSDHPFLTRDFGVVETIGEPDISAIDHIKLSVWAGDRTLKLWCDELHRVSRFDTGKVLLQFEGGYDSAVEEALPLLEDHDYPATAFVPTDRIGGDDRLDRDAVRTLQESGWTTGSQGTSGSDLTELSSTEQRAAVESAAEWLADFGVSDPPFAYPFNRVDESTLEAVADEHNLGFLGSYPVCGEITNPHLCPTAVRPSVSVSQQLLEWTAKLGTITVLRYDDLAGDSLEAFEKTVSRLAELEAEDRLEVIEPATLIDDALH